MTDKDLYWMSGLLEGEGYFGINKRKYTTKDGTIKEYLEPYIHLQMTDKDVVEKYASIIGSTIRTHQSKRENRKLLYRCGLNGKKKVIPLLQELYPLMGKRRQQRIKELLCLSINS